MRKINKSQENKIYYIFMGFFGLMMIFCGYKYIENIQNVGFAVAYIIGAAASFIAALNMGILIQLNKL